MREIDASYIGELVRAMCLDVSFNLPPDVSHRLSSLIGTERSSRGRKVLEMILENAGIAAEKGVPICQDTGYFSVWLFLGAETHLTGDVKSEVDLAVREAAAEGDLRASLVSDPAGERLNTGDNTPAFFCLERVSSRESYLAVMAKGGGCEMACSACVLPPAAGFDGILDFVRETVERSGAGSCPPLFLGVGVGGSFDLVPRLSKLALLMPFDSSGIPPGVTEAAGGARGRDAEWKESLIAEAVNGLGIGPGALGGTVTCAGVRIVEAPCHIANLPVAVNVNCHVLRRKIVRI